MKRTALLAASLAPACQTTTPPPAPPQVKTAAEKLAIAPDTPQRATQLPRTLIDYDRSLHELSHGLGPGSITQPNGERVEVRIPLKNLYSTIEECKADVLGVWNTLYAQQHQLLTAFDERQLFATFAGLMFRGTRFGTGEAHGRGTAVQWNWLRERGAITPSGGQPPPAVRFAVDFPKMRHAVRDLATELLTIEATGDYNAPTRCWKSTGMAAEMRAVNATLKDIPVDIWPVFPAAGEQ